MTLGSTQIPSVFQRTIPALTMWSRNAYGMPTGTNLYGSHSEHQFLFEHSSIGLCHRTQFLSGFLRWHFAKKKKSQILSKHVIMMKDLQSSGYQPLVLN